MTEAAIVSDRACELGEGPAYDPATGTLWWFNILGRELIEMKWPDGETIVHALPFMASALGIIDAKRQLLLTERGFYIRDIATGDLTLHTSLEDANPNTRSNDARVHPCGAFWAGTMGKRAETGAGAIYWFFKGEVKKLYANISIPNSICFSPDGGTAYFTDTKVNRMMRVACDPKTGLPIGEPSVLHDQTGGVGALDGSVCDTDGTIWNARWGAGSVDSYAPDGTRLSSHPLPARQVTCPVFCGADAGSIAVTSAWEHMDEKRRAADPHAGKTFRLPIAVRGRFDAKVLI